MNRGLLCVAFLLTTLVCSAQYSEKIGSLRPGRSFGSKTVGKEIFQIQAGIAFGENGPTNNISNLIALRYGLIERLELRSAFLIRRDKFNSEVTSGLGNWIVGVRYNLINGSGYQPSFGIQLDTRLTTITSEYQPDNLGPRALLLFNQKLSEAVGLASNFGVSWDGNNNGAMGEYTLKLDFKISDNVVGFGEVFGNFADGNLRAFFDTGIGYFVNNNLKLDFSVGYGKNNSTTTWFADGGVSVRFGRRG
ncbi:MAG: transporter [Cyclobacteriaceae bacterium]